MKCIFRRTRGGAWAVYGPADVVKAGATVTVEKKDGTTVEVEIARTGKEFDVDGTPCVYGYRVAKEGAKTKNRRKRRSKRASKLAAKVDEAVALRSEVAELRAKLAQLSSGAGEALAEAGDALAEAGAAEANAS
jgi:hypothetical protein